jgi:hypothetical protein
LKRFLFINLGEVKEGEFWNRLERASDLSKNVSEPAKNDLGNSLSRFDTIRQLTIHQLIADY